MWRRSIFRGLRRWFPELIPTVRLWYARRGCLFTFGSLATDRDDRVYYSEEGCAQGDPLLVLVCVGTQCVPSVATRVVAKIYRPFFL